jgi:hypothetical protein
MYKTIIDPSGLPNLAYFTCVDSFNWVFFFWGGGVTPVSSTYKTDATK